MYCETAEDVDLLVEENRLDDVKASLDEALLGQIIFENRFDLIEKIVQHFKSDIEIESLVFEGVIGVCSEAGANAAALACLHLLISSGKTGFTHDDEYRDQLYYFCQLDDNAEVLPLLLKLEADLPWDYILRTACAYNNDKMVKYLLSNMAFDKEALEKALGGLVNSVVGDYSHDCPKRRKLILALLQDAQVSVNAQVEGESGWTYLDCLRNAPNVAKHFYTRDFDPNILIQDAFWNNFLNSMQRSAAFAEYFVQAFEDLKNSHIDLSELIGLFNGLGQKEMAKTLLN